MNVVYSSTEENYLKAIYHLQQLHERVSTTQLADHMRIRPATATDMLQKLEQKKLLHYKKYYGFTLTAAGLRLAVHVIRKHRLWELFLVEKLHFGWEEVHEIAEELEHISSKKLVDQLEIFLEYPQCDPHGDPIPDINGKMPSLQQLAVTDLPINSIAVVNGISDQSQDMLELLKHKNIHIGTRIEVKKRFGVDGSVELKLRSQQPVTVSEHVAKNLLVSYDNKSKS